MPRQYRQESSQGMDFEQDGDESTSAYLEFGIPIRMGILYIHFTIQKFCVKKIPIRMGSFHACILAGSHAGENSDLQIMHACICTEF
eukprot:COSAG05_NODE_9236_length_637_cov_1.436803_1_plen_86_part_10